MRLLIRFIILSFAIISSLALQASPKEEMLQTFSRTISPDMAKIWDTYLANFDEQAVHRWSYSEHTGNFFIELRQPLKLYIPPKPKKDEPPSGSILIFGLNGFVKGKLDSHLRNIQFDEGFYVYTKYKMGFLTLPVTAQIFNFTYLDHANIQIEAGKGGITQKRLKSTNDYLKAWNSPHHVVNGDHAAFLEKRS